MTRARSRACEAPGPEGDARACDFPGCGCAGLHRAPKGRDALREYWWFCLEHVRAYNASWDFYKGMDPRQIEAQLRADTAWQRPTWPLGRLGGRHGGWAEADRIADPLEAMARRGARAGARAKARTGARERGFTPSSAPAPLREPLSVMELSWPTTLAEVKIRYKALAKRYHPDANGGSQAAEERLKTINIAYAALKRGLEPANLAATG